MHGPVRAVCMAEACDILSVHRSTVYKLMKFDRLFPKPFRRHPNGKLFWTDLQLTEYLTRKATLAQGDERAAA